MARTAQVTRSTKETSIDVSINLDGSGTASISTGIPFYDHMLEQLGKHLAEEQQTFARPLRGWWAVLMVQRSWLSCISSTQLAPP